MQQRVIKVSLEVLISAMHLDDIEIVKRTGCNSDVLIINQSDTDDYQEVYDKHLVRMITTTERGLANSRNMAIQNAKGDICLICDDDEELVCRYEETILSAFEMFPEADIIAFEMKRKNSNSESLRYKKTFNYGVKKKAGKVSFLKTYASVQLAFRRESIVKNHLLFDTRFGAGSGKIAAGDETVWQVEAKRKGLRIYFCPTIITTVGQEQSKWFDGLNEKYYFDLGACLSVNYPFLKQILKYYYVLFIHGSQLSMCEQIKWLNAGIYNFGKKNLSYEEYCRNCEGGK